MTFGLALDMLKKGHKVCRKGWNGKGMYVYLRTFSGCDPCIMMRTAAGGFQPGWIASQADMLSEDWEVLK